MSWLPFAHGKTVGTSGSEEGLIIRDEEHSDGARMTLERDGSAAPYAITCGIYGWMVHTRFFDTEIEAESEFEAMKLALQRIVVAIPLETDPDAASKSQTVLKSIEEFVETNFP